MELDWKCPGRRPPTPPDEKHDDEEEEVVEDDGKDMAFDFEDEFTNTTTLNTPQQRRIAAGGGLKGSARKMTTSLDGVLSNMRRHRIEDNMESEQEKKESS